MITLSHQGSTKLLKQWKRAFKRTINLNKYQSKILSERQNQYLDFLIEASFQGVNRHFVLSFKNDNDREVHTNYYLPKVEIKDYELTDGKNIFDQRVKSNMRTYDNTRQFTTGHVDDYTIGCLLGHY